MTKTITHLFDTYAEASQAVQALEHLGIAHDDISIIANNAEGNQSRLAGGTNSGMNTGTGPTGTAADDVNDHGDVNRGTKAGALLGGAGGLLAGLGLLAIPGLGPVVAAGWLASTAAGAAIGGAGGAATGGIVGALKNSGHTDEEAHVFSEGVHRGGTLVSARVPDGHVDQAMAILTQHNAVDTMERGTAYRAGGWSQFDDNAPAYSGEEVARGRSQYGNRSSGAL